MKNALKAGAGVVCLIWGAAFAILGIAGAVSAFSAGGAPDFVTIAGMLASFSVLAIAAIALGIWFFNMIL